MTDQAAAPTTIDNELPCAACGYLLRGLASDAACPECGTGIGESLKRVELWHSDARWLGRVRWGGVLVLAGAGLGYGVRWSWHVAAMAGIDLNLAPEWIHFALFALTAVSAIVYLGGIRMVTRPDRYWSAHRPQAARAIALVRRITLIAAVLTQALWLIPELLFWLDTMGNLIRLLSGASAWFLHHWMGLIAELGMLLILWHMAKRACAHLAMSLGILMTATAAWGVLSSVWIILVILEVQPDSALLDQGRAGIEWLLAAFHSGVVIACIVMLNRVVKQAQRLGGS